MSGITGQTRLRSGFSQNSASFSGVPIRDSMNRGSEYYSDSNNDGGKGGMGGIFSIIQVIGLIIFLILLIITLILVGLAYGNTNTIINDIDNCSWTSATSAQLSTGNVPKDFATKYPDFETKEDGEKLKWLLASGGTSKELTDFFLKYVDETEKTMDDLLLMATDGSKSKGGASLSLPSGKKDELYQNMQENLDIMLNYMATEFDNTDASLRSSNEDVKDVLYQNMQENLDILMNYMATEFDNINSRDKSSLYDDVRFNQDELLTALNAIGNQVPVSSNTAYEDKLNTKIELLMSFMAEQSDESKKTITMLESKIDQLTNQVTLLISSTVTTDGATNSPVELNFGGSPS